MFWSLLWQNKGLVALGVLLVLFLGLGTALKVQSARLAVAKSEIREEREAKEEAIRAHDRLVMDWERQQKVLNEREVLRKQQEEENAKLHQTIQDLLKTHRAWASAALPRDLVGVLQALPSDPSSAAASTPADAPTPIHRADKRRFTLLGTGK